MSKYFSKEVDRLMYFEQRKELRAKEKREMEAEDQRRKSVSLGAPLMSFVDQGYCGDPSWGTAFVFGVIKPLLCTG